jgi:hypothetical protein
MFGVLRRVAARSKKILKSILNGLDVSQKEPKFEVEIQLSKGNAFRGVESFKADLETTGNNPDRRLKVFEVTGHPFESGEDDYILVTISCTRDDWHDQYGVWVEKARCMIHTPGVGVYLLDNKARFVIREKCVDVENKIHVTV